MTRQLCYGLMATSLLFIFMISPAAGITYFKPDGTKIESAEFDKIVNARQPSIEKISRNGYETQTVGFEDPVLLRQKRIEQWKNRQASKR